MRITAALILLLLTIPAAFAVGLHNEKNDLSQESEFLEERPTTAAPSPLAMRSNVFGKLKELEDDYSKRIKAGEKPDPSYERFTAAARKVRENPDKIEDSAIQFASRILAMKQTNVAKPRKVLEDETKATVVVSNDDKTRPSTEVVIKATDVSNIVGNETKSSGDSTLLDARALMALNLVAGLEETPTPSIRFAKKKEQEAKAVPDSKNNFAEAKAKVAQATSHPASNGSGEKYFDAPTRSEREQVISSYVTDAQEQMGLRAGSQLDALESPVYKAAPASLQPLVKKNLVELVNNDIRSAPPSASVEPLSNLVENAEFQKVAERALGPERTEKLNLAVAGATIAKDSKNDKSILTMLGDSLKNLTGVPVASKVATKTGPKGFSKTSLTKQGLSAGGTPGAAASGSATETLGWIDFALNLSSENNLRGTEFSEEEKIKLRAGRAELQDLRSKLSKLYQSAWLQKIDGPCAFTEKTERMNTEKALLQALEKTKQIKAAGNVAAKNQELALLKTRSLELKNKLQKNKDFSQKAKDLSDVLLARPDILEIWALYDVTSAMAARKSAAQLLVQSKILSCEREQTNLSYLIEKTFRYMEEEKSRAAKKTPSDPEFNL